MNSWTSRLLEAAAYSSPTMLVWLIGVVFAVLSWRRHPRISLLTALTLALFVMSVVAHATVSTLLGSWMSGDLIEIEQYERYMRTLFIIRTTVSALLFALLLTCIFSGRRHRASAGNMIFK